MRLKAAFVRKRQHLVVHPTGIPDPQNLHPTVHQLLADPVDRHVALRTHQHLILPVQRLVNRLYQRRCLSRSRRSVYDGYVLGMQHLVDRLLLRPVQPRETHRKKSKRSERQRTVEDIPQVRKPVVLGRNHLLQCLKHQPVAGLVEIKLHPCHLPRQQLRQCLCMRQNHHHPVLLHIIHRSREIQISQFAACILRKETDRPSIFKLMFNLLILTALNLNYQLVQRIIITSPHADRIPAHPPLDFPSYPHSLRLLLKLLFLVVVFLLQQFILLLQIKHGRRYDT